MTTEKQNAPTEPPPESAPARTEPVEYVTAGTKLIHVATPPSAPPPTRSLDSILDELLDPKNLERQRRIAGAYGDAVAALVGPDDVQLEGGKEFKKKSAWRKLARAFGLSWYLVRNERWWEYDEAEATAHLIARVVVRVRAPWGQEIEAEGLCSTREGRFYSKGIACPVCGGSMWDNRGGRSRNGEDFRCRDNACGGQYMPGEYDEADLQERRPNAVMRMKADHDVEATAATRAANRGISDLIAGGEVSAEEVVHMGDGAGRGEPARRPSAAPAGILDAKAFGNEWRGRTWREVVEAGDEGWGFIEWAITKTDRFKPADAATLRSAIAEARAARRAASAPPPAEPAQEAAQEAAPEPRSSDAEYGHLDTAHAAAMAAIRKLGPGLPDNLAWKHADLSTDNLREFVRANWRDLKYPGNVAYAVSAARAMEAWHRKNPQGAPPSAPAGDATPNPTQDPPAAAGGQQGGNTADGGRPITQAQIRRLFAIAAKSDLGEAGLRWLLQQEGIDGFEAITRSRYDALCELAEDPDVAARFGEWVEAEAERHAGNGYH
jgi:hypothetical protein